MHGPGGLLVSSTRSKYSATISTASTDLNCHLINIRSENINCMYLSN